ncbi:MAG: hypothetical protein Q4E89_12255, partial [Eubacteriales bacterium]|nr:hypothetical protein [Eubacteriales bacterium]
VSQLNLYHSVPSPACTAETSSTSTSGQPSRCSGRPCFFSQLLDRFDTPSAKNQILYQSRSLIFLRSSSENLLDIKSSCDRKTIENHFEVSILYHIDNKLAITNYGGIYDDISKINDRRRTVSVK